MAKVCPETGEKVLYPECLECETKACRDDIQTIFKKSAKNLKKGSEKLQKSGISDTYI